MLMFCSDPTVMGNDHPRLPSLLMVLPNAAEFIYERDYLWFLIFIIAYRSDFLFSSLIEDKW